MDITGRSRIPVTRTTMPDMDVFLEYLQGIWDRRLLTNNGPLVQELETKLRDHLGVRHCLVVSSGTIALQLAIKALQLRGEIITTPFSFVATSSVIAWEGCQPLFADIEPKSLCIDPSCIETVLTSQTQAILATHIYGYPCAVEAIQELADRYHLKVVYDAAHAFGVKYRGQSLLNYGDLATLSFHATKLFYTGEGGAIVCSDDDLAERIRRMRDFGIDGPEAFFPEIGVNGKMSELHAALGLSVLPSVDASIGKRREICNLYESKLFHHTIRPACRAATEYNYSYYPVLFNSGDEMLKVQRNLNKADIYPRRYFYPPLSRLTYVRDFAVPIAEDIASRILCLPLYDELDREQIERICAIVIESLEMER